MNPCAIPLSPSSNAAPVVLAPRRASELLGPPAEEAAMTVARPLSAGRVSSSRYTTVTSPVPASSG